MKSAPRESGISNPLKQFVIAQDTYNLMQVFPEGLKKEISRIASDLMRIYVAQWILITWIVNALVQQIIGVQYTVTTIMIAGVCVLVASILLARVKPLARLKI